MISAPLIARTVLRLVAFGMVATGYFGENQVSFIYQNADIAALVSLAISEIWLAAEKAKAKA